MIWVESAWPVDGTRVHWTHKHHRVRLTRPYWVALIHSSPLHSADKFCYQDSSTLTRSHLCQNLITISEKGKGTRERGSSCSSMATEEQVHALKDMLRELVNYCGEWWLHRMRHGCSFCSQGFEMHHLSLSRNLDNVTVPPHFRCPLSGNLMTDPVILATGQVDFSLFPF